jgi:hypothetical protein
MFKTVLLFSLILPLYGDGIFSDSLSFRLLGSWPFGPSYSLSFDTVRNLVLLGSGGGIFILDLNDPYDPSLISDGVRTRGVVKGLFYDSSTQILYIAAQEEGLEIWDLSNLENPQKIGNLSIPGSSSDIHVSENYAYLCSGGWGLRIIDISDPTNPYEVGFFDTSNCLFSAKGVYVFGNYAYVAGGLAGLYILDVSDPSNPQMLGVYDSVSDVNEVYFSDGYAYLTDGYHGLRIIDVSNPFDPWEVGDFLTDGNVVDVYIRGIYGYLVDGERLWILDISEPTDPQEIGFVDVPALSVQPIGNYVCTANGNYGLSVINISNLSYPYQVGDFKTPGPSLGIYVRGNYAFLATGESGLKVIDISEPNEPREVGSYDTPGSARDILLAGDYAYIACEQGGIRIFDISDPSNPEEVGSYTPSWAYVLALDINGNYLYSANSW